MSEDEIKKQEKILPREIEVEMKESYLNYAMSVIVGRALPDVRDGLKPVHRRILYAMNELSMFHNKPFKKSARIVGEVLGKYHPHGDSAVYDALVRLTQPFSLRYPLIQGQGNFGSIDGDSAAAMRYCVTGETLILTNAGILPIRNISSKKEAPINMKILSYNGKKNTASKFFDSGKHKIVEIETKLGYCVKGTHNHPLMCWTLKKNKPQIEWKLAEDITKEEVVILNRNASLFSKADLKLKEYKPKFNRKHKDIGLPIMMNKDLAFLLGVLVAEGSFHQNKIIFNNSDRDLYNRIKDIIYDQFKGIQLYERKIKGNCLELDLYHQKVVGFLKNIGLKEQKSDKKEIPFSVLQSTEKMVTEFLIGLFEGDGSVKYKIDRRHNGKSIDLTYNSKSKILIRQLKTVLLNFGIVTTKPYTDKRNGCFKLIISGYDSIKNYKDKIGFHSDRKRKILDNIDSLNSQRMSKTDFIPYLSTYLRSKYKNLFIQKNNFDRYNNLEKNYDNLMKILDGADKLLVKSLRKNKYLFDSIKNIKKPVKKETVYSVKVESQCHSFVANGFINHNTEARLNKLAEEMLSDIDKETVDFVDNFDGSLKEPSVLPSKLPNLLVNGSTGIAVGMATNIPPHNASEVINAAISVIEKPDCSINEIMMHLKGPDFPTGGIICGQNGITNAYQTGRGRIVVRAKYRIEENKGRKKIVVDEIPYMVNKAEMIAHTASLVRDKKITGISDIRDESDRDGMRIVIELKNDANSEVVVNHLFKHTRMQTTFGIIMLALVGNKPKVLNIKEVLTNYVEHRKDVVIRRTKYELRKSEERAHILEGIIKALNNVDLAVKLIKEATTVDNARSALMTNFSITDKQANAILDLKLQKLASLEQEKIKTEFKNLMELIKKLKEILASEEKVYSIVKNELIELKEKYNDSRRTDISDEEMTELDMEDLVDEEDTVVTVTSRGYIKRQSMEAYKQQKRGGVGILAANTKEEDFIKDIFIAHTHSYLLFFTDKGKIYWLKTYYVPEGSRQAGGKAIVNLLNLKQDEKITAYIPIREFTKGDCLLLATKHGIVKKTSLESYSRPRRGGIIAVNLRDGDKLIGAMATDGNKQILIATKKGRAVKFNENDVRNVGRNATGVRGIRLKQGDEVVGMVVAEDEKTLLTVTEKGYGKRTKISDYRLINRGGSGVINIIHNDRNGDIVTILSVEESDELMTITKNGIAIRMKAGGISVIGRNTQGVRVMKLREGDKLVSATKIKTEEDEEPDTEV